MKVKPWCDGWIVINNIVSGLRFMIGRELHMWLSLTPAAVIYVQKNSMHWWQKAPMFGFSLSLFCLPTNETPEYLRDLFMQLICIPLGELLITSHSCLIVLHYVTLLPFPHLSLFGSLVWEKATVFGSLLNGLEVPCQWYLMQMDSCLLWKSFWLTTRRCLKCSQYLSVQLQSSSLLSFAYLS